MKWRSTEGQQEAFLVFAQVIWFLVKRRDHVGGLGPNSLVVRAEWHISNGPGFDSQPRHRYFSLFDSHRRAGIV